MPLPEPLLKQWHLARDACRNLEITEEGIVLGKTILAPFVKGNLFIDRPRILAMLSIAYCREIPIAVVNSFQRAERCWKFGYKALANMHLALMGLREVDLEIAQRLFACDWGLNQGLSIHQLLKIAGFEKFNPYHLGPGPGGGQFTTAELDGASGGVQVAQNESSGIDGYDRNRPWDFPTPQIFLPVLPQGVAETVGLVGRETAARGLSEAQLQNLNRFNAKLPAGARPTSIRTLSNGDRVFQADVPANTIPGSFARYEKVIDSSGNTLKYTKTTYAPDGSIVHIKIK